MIPKTMSELEELRVECRQMVNKRASASAAAAVVPVLGLDVGADLTIMYELVKTINEKFGLSPSQLERVSSAVKGRILVLATSLGSEYIGRVVTKKMLAALLKKTTKKIAVKQVTKFVPFVGQAVAASISFSAMRYLGNAHVEKCYEVCKQLLEEQTLMMQE
ncbi:hypothetical protein A374_06976 [Fictibacillus macauensis ZFHKF-1]|uniref:Uncharacterized protein n=1 Tax=Fictibacillus macauensis ZFHKF-1 TaxID=1196324 RepID=I8UGW3_9BACL|nr:hypothetical protein [Fictibacillus macauensis]EIT86043.1 hypothetical protein A374_06976 [Fictibacillus macauensis ZFHKF-1]